MCVFTRCLLELPCLRAGLTPRNWCFPCNERVGVCVGVCVASLPLVTDAQELVFAVLLSDDQLITLLRPKRYSLHPAGAHT